MSDLGVKAMFDDMAVEARQRIGVSLTKLLALRTQVGFGGDPVLLYAEMKPVFDELELALEDVFIFDTSSMDCFFDHLKSFTEGFSNRPPDEDSPVGDVNWR